MVPWPPAEFDVDERFVQSLIDQQMPDLCGLELRSFDEGFDNSLWRLGEEYLVRLPRRKVAVASLENEIKWLPELAPRLSAAIPIPLRVGSPTTAFPSCWTVISWFKGVTADVAHVGNFATIARQVGAFLRSLHVPSPSDAPINPFRSVSLRDRAATFEERMANLPSDLDGRILREVWTTSLDEADGLRTPVWIHGDLHPANVVIDNDSLVAVIDFGDLCSGDPATDLAGALMLLPGGLDESFTATYGDIDPSLMIRSLGWAVLFSLMFAELGKQGRMSYYDVGRATLERIIERSR